jgi:hypothetical protein
MSWRRFCIAFDLHGDMQCSATTNAFFRFVRDFKPQDRIIGGDLWDFRSLRAKAVPKEQRETLLPDFEAGMEFFDSFKPNSFLLGNHCQRLWKRAGAGDGPSTDLASVLVGRFEKAAERIGCRVLSYHKRKGVLSLGRLNVIHGFFAGDSAAKKHAAVYGNVVAGHIHAYDRVSLPSYGGIVEGIQAPAMCKVEMEYNESQPGTLRHSNGWVYGEWNDKTFHVDVARVDGGQVVVSTGYRVLAA